MGLMKLLSQLGRSRKNRKKAEVHPTELTRHCRFEAMEPRRMLAADPLVVGAVYVEQDSGSDLRGDTIQLTFEGGAPGTQLTRMVIDGDQVGNFGNLPGFSSGDVFFDTVESGQTATNSGLGVDQAIPLSLGPVVQRDGQVRSDALVSGTVIDGTSLLVLSFSNFYAGDTVTLTIDVDEAEIFDPRQTDPVLINQGFDPLTSGAEFHGSIMTADFQAPHFHDAQVETTFINHYDSRLDDAQAVLVQHSLNVPSDDQDGNRDRTAGAFGQLRQQPLPITIAGTVYHDRDFDLTQDPGDESIAGVTLGLWKKNDSGVYEQVLDANQAPVTRVTDVNGDYHFDASLQLMPGIYQVREVQPVDYQISVGAIPGTVAGTAIGNVSGTNVLTEIAVLKGSQHAVDYDFAEANPASISGYVYHDRDNDGVREPGDSEEAISNVTIELRDDQDRVLQTTATNDDGFYQFTNLRAGTYTVHEVQPERWIDGKDTVGQVNRAGNVGADGQLVQNDVLQEVVLLSGDEGVQYNFGERLGSLQGTVHHDLNGDCVQQQVEAGIAGVLITLTDDRGRVFTTRTDAEGRYRFDDLQIGTYQVTEQQPDDFFHGGQKSGSAGGDAAQPDVISSVLIDDANFQLVEYNFCEHLGSISGFVYHDRSDDGQFDVAAGEEPIVGVTLRLLDSSGQAIVDDQGQALTAITNQDGFYEFTELRPGVYQVAEVQPAGWFDGKDTPGTVDGVPVGTVPSNDLLTAIALVQPDLSRSAGRGEQYNFGEKLGEISGRVHLDLDGDCELDDNESGIEGVTITLVGPGGVTQTAQTDADGVYRFTGLAPGTYSVIETQPDEYFSQGESAGTAGGLTGQANRIAQITLNDQNRVAENYDFCEHLGSLSGYVYHDRDNDGLREPGQEEAIPGTTLLLLDQNGQQVVDALGQPRTAETDAEGFYEFAGLSPGIYQVVELQPEGWFDGKDTPGTVDGSAQGIIANNDHLGTIALLQPDLSKSAGRGINYNFGERLGTLAGRVHLDRDGDCVLDPDEQGLEGVTIILVGAQGERLTTQTDSEGRYLFADLKPGTYTVLEEQPAEYFDGGQMAGNAGGNSVGANRITDVTLSQTQFELVEYNFCEHLGEISGYVYHDRDNDGIREPASEDGISGVTIHLVDENGVEQTTVTDDDGFYSFDELPPGTYTVFEIQPSGWLDGLDTPGQVDGVPRGSAPQADVLELIPLVDATGRVGTNYNFGELLPASIQGVVHADLDRDCVVDEGEQLLSGVTIQLFGADGQLLATTVTDVNGQYSFEQLRPGTYTVVEQQPEDYFHGGQRPGTTTGAVVGRDRLGDIDVLSGDVLVGYDFCEEPPSRLSGIVFRDGPPIPTADGTPPADIRSIRDGSLTADDLRLPGVVVELRDGLTGEVILGSDTSRVLPGYYGSGPIRATTNANGYYEFNGLRGNQSYAVFEVQPEDYFDGIDTPGTTAGVAINPNDVSSQFVLLTLTVDPKFDAIVRIPLGIGQSSEQNNFSEIETTTPIPPPPPEPPQPPLPPPQPPLAALPDPPPPLPLPPAIPQPRIVEYISAGYPAYTWHLSVVDGGHPRGEAIDGRFQQQLVDHNIAMDHVLWMQTDVTRGTWHLRHADDSSREIEFGIEGGTPVVGDFNGDGVSEVAIYLEGQWFIDVNGNGVWDDGDLWALLGDEHDRPVVGDWDGDGKDDIGIFGPIWAGDPRAIHLEPGLPDAANQLPHPGHTLYGMAEPGERREMKNPPPSEEQATNGLRMLKKTADGESRADLIDHVFSYGRARHIPLAGDWNGDGIDTIGVFHEGAWQLDSNGDGLWAIGDSTAQFGQAGDIPVVGDFDGNGVDEIGIFRNGRWMIDSNHNGELDAHDRVFELGAAGDHPVVGDWDADGVEEPGIYRSGNTLRKDGPHQPSLTDRPDGSPMRR